MTCVEQNAVSRSHQRLRCQSRPGDSSPRCGLGTQKPKGCPEGLGRVNGEAGELGAAATAPEAQSKLLRFPASPAQPQPCSTASAAAPAHHRGSLAEREEASERQALHHSALTLQLPLEELQDAVRLYPYIRAGQELKHTAQCPGVPGRQDPGTVQGWVQPAAQGASPTAAAATRQQSGGRQLSEAALAVMLTSTRNAMAETSQRGFFLLSRSTR